jgi:hypothetical protein
MKLLSLSLFATAVLTLLSSCETSDDSHLTPRQQAITHSGYDPVPGALGHY